MGESSQDLYTVMFCVPELEYARTVQPLDPENLYLITRHFAGLQRKGAFAKTRQYRYSQSDKIAAQKLLIHVEGDVQLDCQYRSLLVKARKDKRQAADNLHPAQFAADTNALQKAARNLTAELRQTGPGCQVETLERTGLAAFQLEKYPIILAMNFGAFSRQKSQLHMKVFVDPSAYDFVLDKHGQGAMKDAGIPGDNLWLLKTRYWLNWGIHMDGHASVRRIFDSEESIHLQGAPEDHGFSHFATYQISAGGELQEVHLLASHVVSLIVAAKPWPCNDGYTLTAFTAEQAHALFHNLQNVDVLASCCTDITIVMVPSQTGAIERTLRPLSHQELNRDMSAYKSAHSRRLINVEFGFK